MPSLETVRTDSKILDEILWSNVFHDTIKNSKWFINQTISPCRKAVGYPYFYAIYRVLNEFKPKSILETGLGQSTIMIDQFSNYNNSDYTIVEHEHNWVKFFSNYYKLTAGKIIELPLSMSVIDNTRVMTYDKFADTFNNKKFDFISIDGPFEGKDNIYTQYSRADILNLIPQCLNNSFVIVYDDYDKRRCRNTVNKIVEKLNSTVGCCFTTYSGEKEMALICSKNLFYFTTM